MPKKKTSRKAQISEYFKNDDINDDINDDLINKFNKCAISFENITILEFLLKINSENKKQRKKKKK